MKLIRNPVRANRRVLIIPAVAAAVALLAVGCGGMAGMDHGSTSTPTVSATQTGMPGMDMGGMDMGGMPSGDGLQSTAYGMTFTPTATSLPAGKQTTFTFRIVGSDGKPVITFAPDQTKLMHFYLIRSDLTGFQHVHPTMATDGTWTAPIQALQPGSYRVYAAFIAIDAAKQAPLLLGDKVTVPGSASVTPLAPPSTMTQVDGYTLTVGGNQLMAGMTHALTVTVAKDGKPVTDLQPYLDTYAHLTAVHEGDLAFAHLHPQGSANGDHGGPTLTFEAMLTTAGNWRLFVQFQTSGTVHTAAITLGVG
jgi:hypothetical protein